MTKCVYVALAFGCIGIALQIISIPKPPILTILGLMLACLGFYYCGLFTGLCTGTTEIEEKDAPPGFGQLQEIEEEPLDD